MFLCAEVKFLCHTKIVKHPHRNLNTTSTHLKSSHSENGETHSTIAYRLFKPDHYPCLGIARQEKESATATFIRKFLHNTSWLLLNQILHQDTSLHSADHLHIVISLILHTKTYISAIHLSTHHDCACHKYNALCLLRIFINDFKKINRRASL